MVHYQPNAYQHARFGVVVAKKVEKSSVRRNYMRRVLRELFRLQQHEINAADLIVRVQKPFTSLDHAKIKLEFAAIISQINPRIRRLTVQNSDPKLDEPI